MNQDFLSKSWKSLSGSHDLDQMQARNNLIESLWSSHPEVFFGKGTLKICSKFTGEHPWRSAISIKLLCNLIEMTLRHGWSPANLLHIFRAPFPKKTSDKLLLKSWSNYSMQEFKKQSCEHVRKTAFHQYLAAKSCYILLQRAPS